MSIKAAASTFTFRPVWTKVNIDGAIWVLFWLTVRPWLLHHMRVRRFSGSEVQATSISMT